MNDSSLPKTAMLFALAPAKDLPGRFAAQGLKVEVAPQPFAGMSWLF